MSNNITIDADVLQTLIKKATAKENKKRRKGSYELYGNGKARLYYSLDGERYRTTVEVKDEEDAERKLAIFVTEVEKGQFINTNYTFGEFAQIWLDQKVRPTSAQKCVDKYIGALNSRILPYIGNIKLKNLTKQKLEKYFNKIKKVKTNYKNRKENHTVKPDTVKKWKSIIHACLEYAVECELIYRNPCDKIKISYNDTTDEEIIKALATQKMEKIKYYNFEEFKNVCALLEKEFDFFFYNENIDKTKKLREVGRRFLVLLALKSGMRRSELFGLTKKDLSTSNATFNVNKSRHPVKGGSKITKATKNSSSIREKALPSSLIEYLEKYYDLLDKLEYKEKYIFEHLSIDGSCSWFSNWQLKNNIRKIRFHDLRHTHATILLYLGVDIKTISERLGHQDIQTTLNIYADVLKELDKKSVEKIDNL